MNITKEGLRQFKMDFQSAVAELEKQYQVKVELGNIKYSNTSFRAPLRVENVENVLSENTGNKSPEELLFAKYASDYGFTPEDYGKNFRFKSQTFKLVGFNPRAPKNACNIEDQRGKKFKAPVALVKRAIG